MRGAAEAGADVPAPAAKDAKRTGRLAWFGPIDEARAFFGKEKMEEIVKSVNREEEGGEGRADEFILKYAEVQHV